MPWPKGKKRPAHQTAKWMKTRFDTLLSDAKKKFSGDQIINTGVYKSIIHWDTLSIRQFENRARRGVLVTCGKCNKQRWFQFDNLVKQIRKRYFTGICIKCHNGLTWLDKGRERPIRRKIIPSSGYIKIYVPENPMAAKNGEIYEHRFIMSKMINRPLEKWEHVHHKDGNRSNNSPDNLELLPNAEHGSIKDMVGRIKYLENILKKHDISF